MGKKGTNAKKAEAQFFKTAANKIRHINKALETAGGSAIEKLKARLEFYKANKKVKKAGRKRK